MGGCEQALDSGEARRAASKLVFDNNIQVGYIWGLGNNNISEISLSFVDLILFLFRPSIC